MDSTMTICDSVATCVNKTAEICQRCGHFHGYDYLRDDQYD
jgi:hypothetical protein